MATQPDPQPARDALLDLKERLTDAIRDGHPPESPTLAADLLEVYALAAWCRDAGLAFVRIGFEWHEVAGACGVPINTLHSRWQKWYERGGVDL